MAEVRPRLETKFFKILELLFKKFKGIIIFQAFRDDEGLKFLKNNTNGLKINNKFYI